MNAETLRQMRFAPALFRQHVVIDANGKRRPFGQVVEPWQRHAFEAMDNALMRAAGHDVEGGPSKCWIERPRGHSKSSDIGLSCAWLLFAAGHKVSIIAGAGDKDQARILRDAIDRIVRANDWLAQVLTVGRDKVENNCTGSVLEIIASDAATSYGHLCDLIVADEICHWPAAGEEFFGSLLSTSAKRPRCCLVAISNAGFQESWQWNLRNRITESGGDGWYFEAMPGPAASWITQDVLAEQRALLPPKTYARLWQNRWATGVGDAIDEGDIDAALVLEGPLPNRIPDFQTIVAGVDAGWRHDHAAIVVIGADQRAERTAVLNSLYWRPSDFPDGEVPLEQIEETLKRLHQAYKFDLVVYDAWQMATAARRLRDAGVPMWEQKTDPTTQDAVAKALLYLFRERKVDLYHDAALLHDLRSMTVVEKVNRKLKLEGPRDDYGHCDRGFALAMCLPDLFELHNTYHSRIAQDDLAHFPRIIVA